MSLLRALLAPIGSLTSGCFASSKASLPGVQGVLLEEELPGVEELLTEEFGVEGGTVEVLEEELLSCPWHPARTARHKRREDSPMVFFFFSIESPIKKVRADYTRKGRKKKNNN